MPITPNAVTASAGLVTAIKSSLASAPAQWSVTGVLDSGWDQAYFAYYAAAGNSFMMTSVDLSSAAIPAYTGAAAMMSFTYRSYWGPAFYAAGTPGLLDVATGPATFDHGVLVIGGGQYVTTDSALDQTILTLANAWRSAKDTALTSTLNAGVPSPATDPLLIPSDLLTAIKASLADTNAGWAVQSRVESIVQLPSALTPAVGKQITVSLGTLKKFIAPGSIVPAQLVYIATLNASGTLVQGQVMVSGALWRTLDAALYTTITTLASNYLTAKDAALTAALS